MNKRTAAEQAILNFNSNVAGVNDEVYREQLTELEGKLRKINKPPMAAWKKKTYSIVLGLGAVWVLMQYLHYEACREKFPTASGWVCMIQSR